MMYSFSSFKILHQQKQQCCRVFSAQWDKGFSLVELLVVLTIMSVLVSSITFVILNKKETLQQISVKIIQNMRLVQQRAIRENKPYSVEINLSQNSLDFLDDVIELAEDISITVRTSEDQLIENDLVALTFYPDGSSSGSIVTLETDDGKVDVEVIWISGKISLKHHVKAN